MRHNNRETEDTGKKKERRIRLSPNTAIQFYDVQDRLGFDQASKAIDWLMKEAKVSIDALYQDTTTIFSPNSESFHYTLYDQINQQNFYNHPLGFVNPLNNLFSASKDPLDFTWNYPNYNETEGYGFVSGEPSFDTWNNGFVNDNGLVGFCFQQEIQVQEDEMDNVGIVPGFPDTSV